MPIWLSNPSTVCAYGTAMMPALLTSTSTLSTPSANARTEARSCRSSLRTSTSPVICRRGLVALGGVAHGQDHLGPDPGQLARGDHAEAAVGAGDDDGAAGK